MRSTLKVTSCITKCVLAIIYSNSFSHCKVDQKKTVAISQMFIRVQLHVHCMHLLNNRICRHTYSINIYLQYKYYIIVTKTGRRHPIPRPRISSAEVRGNFFMKMGTQQQYNNQDSYVNKFVPPRKWTLLCSVW